MGRHSIKSDSVVITISIGVLAVGSSITLAFIVGMAVVYLLGWLEPVPGKVLKCLRVARHHMNAYFDGWESKGLL